MRIIINRRLGGSYASLHIKAAAGFRDQCLMGWRTILRTALVRLLCLPKSEIKLEPKGATSDEAPDNEIGKLRRLQFD